VALGISRPDRGAVRDGLPDRWEEPGIVTQISSKGGEPGDA
jgi:hypothetical protein